MNKNKGRFMKISNEYVRQHYRGIHPSDRDGRASIHNPERGFRYENMLLLREGLINPFTGDKQDGDILKQKYQEAIENERFEIVQQYVYLSDYVEKNLDGKAFQLLTHIFEQAKSAGTKLLLRFVYKYNANVDQAGYKEPNIAQLKTHMHQLRGILNNGVIYALQFGWIGLWGEQHNTTYSAEQIKNIYSSFFVDFMPASKKITMRDKSRRDALIDAITPLHDEDKIRIGYNNDYYTLDAHPKAPGNDFLWNTPVYNDLKSFGFDSIYDVEMPYSGNDDEWNLNFVPPDFGWGTIFRFTELGASTFSIIHNKDVCIAALRNEMVTNNRFDSVGFIRDLDYFWDDERDNFAPRSAFDYIRDHLGYRLVLEEATYPGSARSGDTLSVNFLIRNFGFARAVNKRPIAILLLNDTSHEVVFETFLEHGAEQCAAGRGHLFSHSALLKNLSPGSYRIALWLPDEDLTLRDTPAFDIRLANAGDNFTCLETKHSRFNIFGSINIVE